MRPTPVLLSVLLLAGCASAPTGGSSYEQVARGEVDRYAPQLLPPGQGWAPDDATRTGQLREGQSRTVSFRLQPGYEYGIVAGCDQDCTDVDLEIRDESGQVLDSDYLQDDFPLVTFTPRTGGTHYLDVSMYSCSVEPCWYAYRVFRRGGGRVSPTPGPRPSPDNQWTRVARAELERYAPEFFPTHEGWRAVAQPTIRSLSESQSEDLTIRLNGGVQYGILGACDQDCSDVDLYVYDDQGRELDSDVLADDYPVLNFRAPYGGSYTLRVRMYQCSVEPCYYAYQIFTR